jgi:hypothetical protein
MITRHFTTTTIAFGFVASIAAAQSAGDVKAGKVYVSGENPVIRLQLKEGSPPVTSVSFWRVIYSPAGMGHVCYVTSDPTGDGASKDDLRVAFTDNPALLAYLSKEIMSAFDNVYVERPFPGQQARFDKSGDTVSGWRETIMSSTVKVELVWRDFYEPFLLDTPSGGQRNPYGITSLFIPARSAEVLINGVKVAGQPVPQMRGTRQSSSAFMAFSETWVK